MRRIEDSSFLMAIMDIEESYKAEVAYWKEQALYWRKKHVEASIKHGNEMFGMFGIVLNAALDGAFKEKPRA